MAGAELGPLFMVLSFEGPDAYSRAGGLASRVDGLTTTLAAMGFETHLFFVGSPDLPGLQQPDPEGPVLHRWCQWISRHHPAGVYDGEDGKIKDWTSSLPEWVTEHLIMDAVAEERPVLVLAEEWQTAESVIRLDEILKKKGIRGGVQIAWNANNVFGFDRIDWPALKQAAVVTTVSRFMRHQMAVCGVDARVIPNGIHSEWLGAPRKNAVQVLRRGLRGRFVATKIARWDPDKHWLGAVEAIARLKNLGVRPLLLARGGMESDGAGHSREVIRRALALNLRVKTVRLIGPDTIDMARRIVGAADTDILLIESYLAPEQSKVLYRASNAVLANSRMEPFGLVGLEAMASGGVAVVGNTGEDYVTPGHDAIAVPATGSDELVASLLRVYWNKGAAREMRLAGHSTAARYTWEKVILRVLLPYIGQTQLLRIIGREQAKAGTAGSAQVAATTSPRRRSIAKTPVEPLAAGQSSGVSDDLVGAR